MLKTDYISEKQVKYNLFYSPSQPSKDKKLLLNKT